MVIILNSLMVCKQIISIIITVTIQCWNGIVPIYSKPKMSDGVILEYIYNTSGNTVCYFDSSYIYPYTNLDMNAYDIYCDDYYDASSSYKMMEWDSGNSRTGFPYYVATDCIYDYDDGYIMMEWDSYGYHPKFPRIVPITTLTSRVM